MTKPATDMISAPVWDAFVRCFHWSLVSLFAISVASGKVGGEWIVWHMRSGYAILALVVFRLIWGFVGGEYARYTSFLTGPVRGIKFAKGLLGKAPQHVIGHNPVGGWPHRPDWGCSATMKSRLPGHWRAMSPMKPRSRL